MSEQDLCVKCHEYYCDKYGVGAFFRPDQHCHHEPKWKPNGCKLESPKKQCVDFEMKVARGWCKDCLHWERG